MSELKRFKDALQRDYNIAFSEIKNGRKISHWMWYVFPQVAGLGLTDTSRFYAINDINEATDFLRDPELSLQLCNICKALLELETNDAREIFGSPDDLKLKSSMTLFDAVPVSFPVFGQVLDKFYGGERDRWTMQLLGIKPRSLPDMLGD